MTDAIGVDSGQRLEGDGCERRGAPLLKGKDSDVGEGHGCEQGRDVVETVGYGVEV